MRPPFARALSLLPLLLFISRAMAEDAPVVVTPKTVKLDRNFARTQLVVSQVAPSGQSADRSADLTRTATYASANPDVVQVDPTGHLLAMSNGETLVRVTANGGTVEVPVTVAGVEEQPQIEFIRDIQPLIAKAGCNMGACHAQQYGQGGFKLSVFGFDPSLDRNAIVRDRHQRRINLIEPEQSLFLLKPTMQVPHGGGKRLGVGSVEHQTLVAWLKSAAPGPKKERAVVTGLSVFPNQRVGQKGLTQQLRVEASYADGSVRDVTALALYDAVDSAMLDVTDRGHVSAIDSGHSPVLVRFEGQAAIALFIVPYPDTVD